MIKNNQKIKMITLLKMAAIYCPVKLREQIEGVLETFPNEFYNKQYGTIARITHPNKEMI